MSLVSIHGSKPLILRNPCHQGKGRNQRQSDPNEGLSNIWVFGADLSEAHSEYTEVERVLNIGGNN
jgi:hypothetical protein